MPGFNARTSFTHSAKWPAPRSGKSSRSTEVITTYFNFISWMVSANLRGSSGSGGKGLPCATSQKGQRRVQIAPRIIKVAVPWLKHSCKFGQDASSHTECRP